MQTLGLTPFIQHSIFEVYPHCSMWHDFIPFVAE